MLEFLRRVRRRRRTGPWLSLAPPFKKSRGRKPETLANAKILLVTLNAMGDGLMTTGLIRGIKTAYPSSSIEILCHEHVAAVFSLGTMVDRIYVLSRAPSSIVAALRKEHFDIVFDCSAILESACLVHALGANWTVGFSRVLSDGFRKIEISGFYNQSKPYSEQAYYPQMALSLSEDWLPPGLSEVSILYQVDAACREDGRKCLIELGIEPIDAVMLAPGAKWPPRRWPEKYWSRLCDLIDSREGGGLKPILIGGKTDEVMIDRIVADSKVKPSVIISKPVSTVAGILTLSRGTIVNDSFLLHLSAAVGVNVVALFGPGSPERTSPRVKKVKVLYRNDFCSPCSQYYTAARCWRGANFCLLGIKPEFVFGQLESLLNNDRVMNVNPGLGSRSANK